MIKITSSKARNLKLIIVSLTCLSFYTISCQNLTSLLFPNGTKLSIQNNSGSTLKVTSFEGGMKVGEIQISSMQNYVKLLDDRENNKTIMASLRTDSLVISRISDNAFFDYSCEGNILFGPCLTSNELPNLFWSNGCKSTDYKEEGLTITKECTFIINDSSFDEE